MPASLGCTHAVPHHLVVIRHAKAEQTGANDYERDLTGRGRADATAAGAWLAGAGVVPDQALVSAAPRAAQTWEALASGADWSLEADLDRGLYAAGPDTALDVLRPWTRTAVVRDRRPQPDHGDARPAARRR